MTSNVKKETRKRINKNVVKDDIAKVDVPSAATYVEQAEKMCSIIKHMMVNGASDDDILFITSYSNKVVSTTREIENISSIAKSDRFNNILKEYNIRKEN